MVYGKRPQPGEQPPFLERLRDEEELLFDEEPQPPRLSGYGACFDHLWSKQVVYK